MKLVSIWLHAAGVGLFGIYQTAIDTIATITELGLRQSAVREVAQASGESASILSKIVAVVRKWSVMSGLLGAVVISGLSPLLGNMFFGSPKWCLGFVALSVSMFLNAIVNGEQAVMQGTGMLRNLAKGSLWGTVTGLAVSIPMFYFMGEKSVVASIVAYSVSVAGFTWWFRYKGVKPSQALGLRQVWHMGSGFARFGICIAMATFATNLGRMALLGILSMIADISEVGYFQAGDTLVSRYIGLVFTAIGMEFFPRLAAHAKSNARTTLFVNHEATLLLMIVTSVVLLFLLLRGVIIDILYTPDFRVITTFISLAAPAALLKVLSTCMGLTIIARGDGKTYFLTEAVDAVVGLAACVAGYKLWGLTGIGWGYIVWNLIYVLIVGRVYYRRYHLRLSQSVLMLFVICAAMAVAGYFAVEFLPVWLSAVIFVAMIAAFIPRLRRML